MFSDVSILTWFILALLALSYLFGFWLGRLTAGSKVIFIEKQEMRTFEGIDKYIHTASPSGDNDTSGAFVFPSKDEPHA